MLEYILLREDCDIDPGSVNRMDKEHLSALQFGSKRRSCLWKSGAGHGVGASCVPYCLYAKNYTPMVWIASIGDKNQEIVQDIILARDTELRALIQK